MTKSESDDMYFGTDIDTDYIDVETRRADVSTTDSDDDLDRSTTSVEHVDMSHIFDTGSGAGASSGIDELIDENAVVDHDGRATTRTFYYANEAPERTRKRFQRMLRWQEGERDDSVSGGRRGQNLRADTRRWVETFTSLVGMSSYQAERTMHVVEDITLMHMAHYSTQEVILGVMSIVANEDNWFIRDDEQYKQLVADVGTDLRTLKSVRDLIHTKTTEV